MQKRAKLKKLRVVTFSKRRKSDIFLIRTVKKKNLTKLFLQVENEKVDLRHSFLSD